MSRSTNPSGLLNPLRKSTFRNLLIADVVSDIGTFMQGVGAVWMMVSLNAGPFYIALVQTASALPFFIFALPAGALGDIVDRRKLILLAEIWMGVVAIMLAVLSLAGRVSPMLLLVLTFALSAGDALESPAWRAALPELVPKEDIAPAATLNGIEFNFARAVGPALALFLKLPDATTDLSPWVHWRVPVVLPQNAATSDAGPILVTIEYSVDPRRQAEFIKAISKFGRIRRRDGAYSWGVFRDLETPDRFLETFLVDSWAEHLRQHERVTLADRATEERVHSLVQGAPLVRHLVNTDQNS